MKDQLIWKFIQSELSKYRRVLLFTVVQNEKGSPGKTGFKMAVSENGSFKGSVGGGVMEYDIIRSCKKLFLSGNEINTLEKYFHYKGRLPGGKIIPEKQSGLICAGWQIISANLLTVKFLSSVIKIYNSFHSGKDLKIIISEKGLKVSSYGKSVKAKYSLRVSGKNKWQYEEYPDFTETVLIAGSGHVGTALCRLLSVLDFKIIMYDDRKDLLTGEEFKDLGKLIIDKYENIRKHAEKENVKYAVIVTTGFESDKTVLDKLISSDLNYLGLMGTKAKIRKIFSEVIKRGITREQLKKVKAPVGLEINSHTPEEIAVSIAAELIRIRNS